MGSCKYATRTHKINKKNVCASVLGHVHKYEAVLWTLEKLRKTISCYNMINFSLRELKLSGKKYFRYLERFALAKVEKVL